LPRPYPNQGVYLYRREGLRPIKKAATPTTPTITSGQALLGPLAKGRTLRVEEDLWKRFPNGCEGWAYHGDAYHASLHDRGWRGPERIARCANGGAGVETVGRGRITIRPYSIGNFYTQVQRANEHTILHDLPGSRVCAGGGRGSHGDGGGVAGARGNVRRQIDHAPACLHCGAADIFEIGGMLAPELDAGVRNHPAPVEIGVYGDRLR